MRVSALQLSASCAMLKRARVNAAGGENLECSVDPILSTAKRHAGEQLRHYLLDKFCTEGLPGSEVATLAHYISRAGGLGVEDLALDPSRASKHGHAHVKNHMGNVYPEVDLAYVECPVYEKRDACRATVKIPIYLPSTAFSQFLTDDMLRNIPDDALNKVLKGLENYHSHPVVRQAIADNFELRVRPIALYWDGVQYTNNDSFLAFYVTDILSEQKFMSFLLRGLAHEACMSLQTEVAMICANVDVVGGARSIRLCWPGFVT